MLRSKWSEVPFTAQDREYTLQLDGLDDRQLEEKWTSGFVERARLSEGGWAHALYCDVFRGRKVLDIGSGLAFDTVYFAQHGAKVTFVDIARSNLRIVERICKLKGLRDVSFCYLEDLNSLEVLPCDFDFIYAQGSLINAPLELTRMELATLLRHLSIGGRLVMLAYPKARWERDGCLPEAEWGELTDGGAPWMEWLDIDKVMWCLQPANFDVILNFEFHNADFNWFDLIRIDGASNWRLPPSSQMRRPDRPSAPTYEVDLRNDIQPTQDDWGSTVTYHRDAIHVSTGASQWSYACLFGLDGSVAQDLSRYYWVRLSLELSEGAISIGLLNHGNLLHERFLKKKEPAEIFLPVLDSQIEWLVIRNVSSEGKSGVRVLDVALVSEARSI